MRRTIAIIAAILTVPLWTSAPAHAQFDDCLPPDEAPPIFEAQNFSVEPTVFGYDLQGVRDQRAGSIGVQPDADQFGLKVRHVADDNAHHFDDPNEPNYVVAAWLEIDGGAIKRDMLPEDGRMGTDIIEPIFTVLEPLELEYGTHVISVSARDSCGNVGTFTRRVLHVPPAVTIICEGYTTTLCDA